MTSVIVAGGRVRIADARGSAEAPVEDVRRALAMADGVEPGWVRVEDAAALIGVSESTLRHWCAQGTVGASKLGRRWAIPEAEVRRLGGEK